MAVTVANLVAAAGDNVDRTTYTIPSFTVTTGKPCVLWFANSDTSTTAEAPSTVTPMSGVTATVLGGLQYHDDGSVARRLTAIWLVGAGTGSMTVTFPEGQTAAIWIVDELTGADTAAPTGGSVVTNSGSGTAMSVDLGTVASGASVLAGFSSSAGASHTVESGYTQTGFLAQSAPTLRLSAQYRADNVDPTAGSTCGTSAGWGAIGIEVAPASSTFTGTAASTLPAFTQSAAGTNEPEYEGSAAQTLAAFTQSAAGTHTAPVFTGTAASTLAAFTQTAAGTFEAEYEGSAASVLPAFTQSATGTFTGVGTITGTAASVLPAFTQTAAGTHEPEYEGSAASTLPAFTQSATGTHTAPVSTGAAASTLPAFTQVSTGTHTGPIYVGVTSSQLAAMAQAAAGTFTPARPGLIVSTVATAGGSSTARTPAAAGSVTTPGGS